MIAFIGAMISATVGTGIPWSVKMHIQKGKMRFRAALYATPNGPK
jgi:hypothetical protein